MGSDEMAAGTVMLKNMLTGTQQAVTKEEIMNCIS